MPHANVRTELIAGITTFLTMSHIIFVQPAVLSTDFTGKPRLRGTATVLMGLWANHPIALAPGMGENFFFVREAILDSISSSMRPCDRGGHRPARRRADRGAPRNAGDVESTARISRHRRVLRPG